MVRQYTENGAVAGSYLCTVQKQALNTTMADSTGFGRVSLTRLNKVLQVMLYSALASLQIGYASQGGAVVCSLALTRGIYSELTGARRMRTLLCTPIQAPSRPYCSSATPNSCRCMFTENRLVWLRPGMPRQAQHVKSSSTCCAE